MVESKSITWGVCNLLPTLAKLILIDSLSMKGVLVHANIIPDVFGNDLKWGEWSESRLDVYGGHFSIYQLNILF